MWNRIVDSLACPTCGGALSLHIFQEHRAAISAEHTAQAQERGLLNADLDRFVETGLLQCDDCSNIFPIMHGLPVLVPYTTPIHKQFAAQFQQQLSSFLASGHFPNLQPVSGEQFVMNSFSSEWLDYDYDGVIWDLSYEDHEKRFLAEIGPLAAKAAQGGKFLEIGCGIGMTTFFASQDLACDAIGVDLSLAVLRASQHFDTNPFLHFVQGSAFYLPLKKSVANVIYTHGVLHHTYSTRDAVRSVAPHCQSGGWLYVWLYGPASKKGSIARRVAGRLEEATRPSIARHLSSPGSKAALAALSCGYLVVNRFHRIRNSSVEQYNYGKALHAARDRFTPLYAHRHDYKEVAGWFSELGFENVEEVDWKTMPTANQDNYRRNTGVRGRRSTTSEV